MRFERTERLISEGMERGLHIGAQLYASVRGEVAAQLAVGESHTGVPMRDDTIMVWLSSTKPIAAVAAGQLMDRRLLGLDDPVSSHIPEFGTNGKEAVTLRHILTHTAGFRMPIRHWRGQTWDEAMAEVYRSRLEPRWVPGQKAGYHPASSWYVLGELVRRLDGRPFEDYVRDEIFEPLGMDDWWVGIPFERQEAYGDRLGVMHVTTQNPPTPNATYESPEFIAAVRPGGNGRGPARGLGRFYEMLVNGGELDGRRVLGAGTAEMLVERHRVGMFDHTFKQVIDYGLGFIIDSKQYGVDTVPYGYGDHASARTFGHSGAESSTAFGDPEHGLAVALVFNGMCGEAAHQARQRAVTTAIYEDLGLAR
ncbi:MAG: beta-lactamase family protein [Chloroflexi bacterium]|nr:beta-lactamase family protein [Chloroflexota bacterium]